MEKYLKNVKGITLIALIITVIIMLILAGVAISAIVDGEGWFSRTRSAVDRYEQASKDESNLLNSLINSIDLFFDNNFDNDKEEEPEEDADYIIGTVEDLRNFSNDVNSGIDFTGKLVLLGNDIDLGAREQEDGTWSGEEFQPIGIDINNSFKGIFEGQNHVIKGLYINAQDINAGLFSHNKGIIRNLGIEDSYIYSNNTKTTTSDSGTVAGYLATGAIVGKNHDSGQIINCYNASKVELVEEGTGNTQSLIGGIVGGNISNGRIEDCENLGEVLASSTAVALYQGGIVGVNESSMVINCSNDGKVAQVNVQNSSYDCIGGIVGINYQSGNIENCNSKGTITCNTTSVLSCVGGVLGRNGATSTLTNCVNESVINGDMNADGSNIGGVVGRSLGVSITDVINRGEFDFSTLDATGTVCLGGCIGLNEANTILKNAINEKKVDVTITGTFNYLQFGGVLGCNFGEVEELYSLAEINLNMGSIASVLGVRVGGVVGNSQVSDTSSTVKNSYNLGNMILNTKTTTGGTYIGGVIGMNAKSGAITESSYNKGNISYTADGGNSYVCVGGIAGNVQDSAILRYCYNRGNLTGTITNASNLGIAGIVGRHNAGTVTTNYSTGTISCTNNTSAVAGLVGINTGTVASSYYLTGTASKSSVSNTGTITSSTTGAKTQAVMQAANFVTTLNGTYFKADVDNPETEEDDRINDGYPILSWEK